MSWRDLMGATLSPTERGRGEGPPPPKPYPQYPHNPQNSGTGSGEGYPENRSPKSPQSPESPKRGLKSNCGDIGDQKSPPAPASPWDPAPSCEAWEERAAILEHDVGLPRPEAEEQATNRRWLIRLASGWLDTTHTPPACLAWLRERYPEALAILPADDDADPWGWDSPEGGEPGPWPTLH